MYSFSHFLHLHPTMFSVSVQIFNCQSISLLANYVVNIWLSGFSVIEFLNEMADPYGMRRVYFTFSLLTFNGFCRCLLKHIESWRQHMFGRSVHYICLKYSLLCYDDSDVGVNQVPSAWDSIKIFITFILNNQSPCYTRTYLDSHTNDSNGTPVLWSVKGYACTKWMRREFGLNPTIWFEWQGKETVIISHVPAK